MLEPVYLAKVSKKVVAKAISVVLGPHVWLPTLLLVFIFRTGLDSYQIKILFPSIFILLVFVPIAYLYLAPKLKWAKAWDLPERKERIPFFIVVTICTLLSALLVYYFGNQLLFTLISILFILMLVNFFITYFWKISLHAGLNTAGSILVNFLFGWQLPVLYITIPVIFWARVFLSKHTKNQLLAGIAVNSVFLILIFYFLGYTKF